MDIHLSLMNVINYMTKFTKSVYVMLVAIVWIIFYFVICLHHVLLSSFTYLWNGTYLLPVVEKIKNQPIFYFNSENCLLLRKFANSQTFNATLLTSNTNAGRVGLSKVNFKN
jgi:hypothetical protein